MNWKNRSIFVGDNLHVLRGMNSASVDLVYLDPPFNSNRNYSAPVGSAAAGASFKDAWTLDDLDEAWLGQIAEQNEGVYKVCDAAGMTHSKGMKSYLCFMAVRLIELHRVLKDTGSLYLHVDPTASHYLKQILDAVFGKDNFRNEIVWHYSAGAPPKYDFKRKHDIVLRYVKSKKFTFNQPHVPYAEKDKGMFKFEDEDGRKYRINYQRDKNGEYKRYYWDVGTPLDSVWSYLRGPEWNGVGANAKERCGYPTQKPLALLERIIKASSNAGDVVLDPFCGCATTCDAAERLGRQWVGIDLSDQAYKLIRMRLERAADEGALFKGGRLPSIVMRDDIPVRTDMGKQIKGAQAKREAKQRLYGRQEGLCAGCKQHFQYRNMTIDHKVPRSQGGADTLENWQLLCGACNSVKGDRSQEYLIATLHEDGILRG